MQVFEVDFTPPFRRVSMIPELEKQLGVTFPSPTTFTSPGEIPHYHLVHIGTCIYMVHRLHTSFNVCIVHVGEGFLL